MKASIPETFTKIASQFPDKVCIQDDQKSLTYAQMKDQVVNFAALLKSRNIKSGDRILIPIENGVDSVIAFLGILECGATAVLIDPRLPANDLHRVINISNPIAVLSNKKIMERLVPQSMPGIPVWDLQESLAPNPKFFPTISLKDHSDNDPEVAFILFTSGTSGDHKGVMLTHENLIASVEITTNFVFSGSRNYYCVLPLYHIYSLACVVFVTLLKGGFVRFFALENIFQIFLTGQPFILCLVPRILEILYAKAQADPKVLELLKKIGKDIHFVCGGAPLSEKVERAVSALGNPVNCGYGLTETSAVGTLTPPTKSVVGSVGTTPPGMELKIDQPNEKGVGEICIRGPVVMKGYFRDPKATSEAIREGWFHTGDLGYFNAEKYLFITGRIKEVIVLPTGEKAMPQDIESHYVGIKGVKELAVVGIQPKGQVWDEIHAAVIAESKESNIQEIEERIEERALTLPTHLQIQKIHWVYEIPKTSLQKVRRGMLKEMLKDDTGVRGVPAPVTDEPIYLWLRQWLAQAANLDPTEIDENRFFTAYGIDSLNIWQLCEKLNEEYQMNVSPLIVMEHPTIAKLAEYCKENQMKGESSKIPPISVADRLQELPLSFAEEIHWKRAQYPWQNFLYGIELFGNLNLQILERSISDLLERHEIFRTTFVEKEKRLVRQISSECKRAVHFFDFSAFSSDKQTKELNQLATSYREKKLDMRTLPLIEFTIIKISAERHILIALVSRIIVDGMSLVLILEEIAAHYKDQIEGKPLSSLEPLKVQYADFAFWQKRLYEQGLFQSEEEYWKGQFKKMELVSLPGKKRNLTKEQQLLKENLTAGVIPIQIPQILCRQLTSISLQRNSFFQTLLATAFQVALHRSTKSPCITLRELNSDRKKSYLHRMIGYLNTGIGVIANFSRDVKFEELLSDHQKQLHLAVENGNIFFEALVDRWGSLIKGSPSYSLNVSFNFLALPIPAKFANLDFAMKDLHLEEYLYPPGLELDFVLSYAPNGSVNGGMFYKKALFDEASIVPIAKVFMDTLHKVAANPAILISEIIESKVGLQ